MTYALAEIFDMPPYRLLGAMDEERPFYVCLDGVWHELGFKRRCDASRWARKRAERVKHWYTI